LVLAATSLERDRSAGLLRGYRVCDAIVGVIEDEGHSVDVDAPFAGALVPLSAYQKDRRVLSVMIEVNRRLYMDEHSGVKRHDFEKVRATLGQIITLAAEATA
jgi:N-formylglutamate amidohydrolase